MRACSPGLLSLVAQLFLAALFYLAVELRVILALKGKVAPAYVWLQAINYNWIMERKKIDQLKCTGRNGNVVKSSLS